METTETSAIPEVAAQAAENHDKKSPQESFAELRKAKEDAEKRAWQAEKEREMYEKQLQMQYQQKAQQPVPQEEEFDYRQLEQDEYVEGKKLVKAFDRINRQMTEKDKRIAEANQQIQLLQTATEYSDFKDVVTAENIEKYIKSDEDNREAVETAKNPLRKVYNLIKKDARYVADMAQKSHKERPISQEQKRVDEKEGRPKLGSLGVRSEAVSTAAQMSNSTMTRQQRNALWAETQAAARK